MRRSNYLTLATSLIAVGLAALSLGCLVEKVEPPVARAEPLQDTLFGHVLTDDYRWMRERDDPEVIAYLEAENDFTERTMEHAKKLQKTLYDEMVGRLKETDLSVPVRRDDHYYYSRTEEGQQYKIYCRKKGSLEADEEVLLDLNLLGDSAGFVGLGIYDVSPNHRLLAFAIDTVGSERYTLRVKNLETGDLYPDVIDSVSASFEWANDNRTFFYTTVDDAWRPYRLYRHRLGDDVAGDLLVYQEDDEAFWLGVSKSKSMDYLFLELGSYTSSEVHFLDADRPTGKFQPVHLRQKDMEYSVHHHDGYFYIVTNEDAQNFKLMKTRVNRPSKKHWEEVIPHRPEIKLDRLEMFKDHMVLYEREKGLEQIRVRDYESGETYSVEFPEPVYTCWGGDNPDFNSHLLRFNYMSLVTPKSVYDFDMVTHERSLLKQKEVLGGYDPDQYQSERIFAVATDGTPIPISMVYRKGMERDGAAPLYLYGYGAYGISMDPYFSSNRLSLLDRGFIFAIAHVRGGGEMGRQWYDDGKLLKKKNTFTDFIAAAEHLIAEKYTSSDVLIASGGSAGGLLIGTVVNMRPDLFQAVVADVPFVDIMNTMLDESIPLTVLEYEEWGNPNEKEYFEYMLSYSPYDNVEAKAYPHMLITGGLNDTRVQYWEPTKWTARLRATKTDRNRLLLKTNMGAGHGGASGRYDRYKEIAFEFAFVLDVVGMAD